MTTTRVYDRETKTYRVLMLHGDGRATCRTGDKVEDLTEEAQNIATMIALGSPIDGEGPEHLAALILHGVELMLKRDADMHGDVPLDGWRNIYTRFSGNQAVQMAIKKTRARLRKVRREDNDQLRGPDEWVYGDGRFKDLSRSEP